MLYLLQCAFPNLMPSLFNWFDFTLDICHWARFKISLKVTPTIEIMGLLFQCFDDIEEVERSILKIYRGRLVLTYYKRHLFLNLFGDRGLLGSRGSCWFLDLSSNLSVIKWYSIRRKIVYRLSCISLAYLSWSSWENSFSLLIELINQSIELLLVLFNLVVSLI